MTDTPKDQTTPIAVTDDLCDLRLLISAAVKALNESPKKSRARALVVTKLEEAYLWAGVALRTE